MLNESFNLVEKIKTNIFNLQPHSIEVITDTTDLTVIEIIHEYDITVGVGNVIERDYSNPLTETLTYNKLTGVLTYVDRLGVSTRLHSLNVFLEGGSSITIIEIDPDACLIDPNLEICSQGILKLNLVLSIELYDGTETYVSTIIV